MKTVTLMRAALVCLFSARVQSKHWCVSCGFVKRVLNVKGRTEYQIQVYNCITCLKGTVQRKQPVANCGLGNIAACQHDASSEDCLDVFDL